MNKKQKVYNREDWSKFAIGYLSIAELALSEIIEKKHNSEFFDISNIYIPALFNLKHGIEVMLKNFTIEFLNKEALDGSDYSHDIEEIFLRLQGEVKEERLKPAIENYEKENPSDKGSFSGKSIFQELKRIIKKYQSIEVIKKYISTDFDILDCDNTALKYPTNSLTIQLNYEKICSRVTLDDVKESLADTLKLAGIFWQLYIIIYHERILMVKK